MSNDAAQRFLTHFRFESILCGYAAIYLGLSAAFGLGDFAHWVGFVVGPGLLYRAVQPGPTAGAYLWLSRNRLWSGVGRAFALGALLSPLLLIGTSVDGHAFGLNLVLTYPLALVLLVVTAATTEEVFFRGFLLRSMLRLGCRPLSAVLLSALVFAVYHLPYVLGADVTKVVASLLTSFVGGLLLGWTVLRTSNLVAAIAMHAALDGLSAASLIPLSIGS